jgi:hypothetical protein
MFQIAMIDTPNGRQQVMIPVQQPQQLHHPVAGSPPAPPGMMMAAAPAPAPFIQMGPNGQPIMFMQPAPQPQPQFIMTPHGPVAIAGAAGPVAGAPPGMLPLGVAPMSVPGHNPSVPHIPCRDYRVGRCQRGMECRFGHFIPALPVPPLSRPRNTISGLSGSSNSSSAPNSQASSTRSVGLEPLPAGGVGYSPQHISGSGMMPVAGLHHQMTGIVTTLQQDPLAGGKVASSSSFNSMTPHSQVNTPAGGMMFPQHVTPTNNSFPHQQQMHTVMGAAGISKSGVVSPGGMSSFALGDSSTRSSGVSAAPPAYGAPLLGEMSDQRLTDLVESVSGEQ